MKKPRELSIRKTAAEINNHLPSFPGGDEASKFSEPEIVELLDSCIPYSWKTALDLKGVESVACNKQEFVKECEAIERNDDSSEQHTGKRKRDNDSGFKKKGKDKKENAKSSKYCSKHGTNPSHTTKDCWDLNPELRPEWWKGKREETSQKEFQ